MEILWITFESDSTHKTGKQHAYIPKMSAGGNKRNKSLCGKYRLVGEDEKSELWENMKGEKLYRKNACKQCLKMYDERANNFITPNQCKDDSEQI